jgi:DNA adenine methylase
MTTRSFPISPDPSATPADTGDCASGGAGRCPVCGLDEPIWPRTVYCSQRCRRRAASLVRREQRGKARQDESGQLSKGNTSTMSRAALRYYGGKWRLAPWIVAHLPDHTCYVEPFGSAASVLLRKPLARYEVYNDLDGDVVGFFRVLRERPDDLIDAIQRTPFARAEIDLACTPTSSDLDEVERARRMYVRSWQGRHGLPARGRMGWRFERAATRSRTVVEDWQNVAHLWVVADRLGRVQLECDDALRVIDRFEDPDTLFYIDPPYPASTRGMRWARHAYAHELTDEGHRQLAEALRSSQGLAVVSGYPCPLYRELYWDWPLVTRQARTHSGGAAVEALWLSLRAAARLGVRQLSLLEEHR